MPRRSRLLGFRRTNLALAIVVPLALVTGALAFATGSGWAGWVAAGHALVGLGILVLSPSKAAISRRGLRRRPVTRSWASIGLGVSIVVTVLTGLSHSTGIARALGPVTTLQLHVGAALGSIPLFVWHLLARPVAPRRTDLSRRTLLRAGLIGGASLATYGGTSLIMRGLALPGVDRHPTGSYEVASGHPQAMPVTQWLGDAAPALDPPWGLLVSSSRESRRWSLEEIEAFGDRLTAVLDCTGGWCSEQEWEGALLSRLLSSGGGSRSIAVRSSTGYERRFPATDAPSLLLAVRVGGAPLSIGHGAPARLVAPGRRGFWWVKWVASIRADDAPWWWQPPFPLS